MTELATPSRTQRDDARDGGPGAGQDAGPPFDVGVDGGVDAGTPPFCATLPEADVLRVVAGGRVVPEGSYWEPEAAEGEVREWISFECVESIDVLRDELIRSFGVAALTGAERTTDQFYEVDVMNGPTLYHYRQDRCD